MAGLRCSGHVCDILVSYGDGFWNEQRSLVQHERILGDAGCSYTALSTLYTMRKKLWWVKMELFGDSLNESSFCHFIAVQILKTDNWEVADFRRKRRTLWKEGQGILLSMLYVLLKQTINYFDSRVRRNTPDCWCTFLLPIGVTGQASKHCRRLSHSGNLFISIQPNKISFRPQYDNVGCCLKSLQPHWKQASSVFVSSGLIMIKFYSKWL